MVENDPDVVLRPSYRQWMMERSPPHDDALLKAALDASVCDLELPADMEDRMCSALAAALDRGEPEASDPPPLGGTVGRWRLERKLGEGDFGAEYEASLAADAELRATVKILHPRKVKSPAHLRRFVDEARTAGSTWSDHVVQIFDIGESAEGLWYLAMERLHGSSLRERLRAGALDVASTCEIAAQIAEALAAMHQLQIVHRDLKPDNVILVERTDRAAFVKLVDFGVARLRGTSVEPVGPRTRSDVILGTPEYMAPEQWEALPDVDGRADVYALGILIYECLAGAPPFGGDPYECMRSHIEQAVPALPVVGPATADLNTLIEWMTAKDRESRPADAGAVARALRALAVPAGLLARRPAGGATAITLHPGAAPSWSRRRAGAVVAWVAVLVVVIWSVVVEDRFALRDRPVAAVAAREEPVSTDLVSIAPISVAPGSPPRDVTPAKPRANRPKRFKELLDEARSRKRGVAKSYGIVMSPEPAPDVRGRLMECLQDPNLPATYKITLERSGRLHVTDGPAPPSFRDCLEEKFLSVTPPRYAIVRRLVIEE